ncbi:MAG: phosphomethylpyrimidine synthase ThiC, partial [Bacteroidota bacterium]|nr:phosphomethylpyrimidine synthase ThiC [Bacteroidota bacterium]
MKKTDKTPTENTITTGSFPASKKVYVKGKLHDIQVAMREVSLSDTEFNGKSLPNNPVVIYDTSGPYTDTNIKVDVKKGLEPLREKWIVQRNDVEQLSEITSDYGKQRLLKSDLDHLRFAHIRKPYRAKPGMNVSQLHYAKKGIITPEMEYIAIRENQGIEQMKEIGHQHKGESFGANIPKGLITPEFVRSE